LEKGKVEIEKQTTGKSQKIIALEPNQQAVFVKKKGEILVSDLKEETLGEKVIKNNTPSNQDEERKEKLILKERIETKLYTSWKEGEFVFESESFNNLIVRMQRWYGITIELKNDSLKNIEFTGRLKNETIEQALNALKMSQTFNYTMDIKNNVIYIE
jgi:ferric-dicitrate binding protein FerR (iron transport regulator)